MFLARLQETIFKEMSWSTLHTALVFGPLRAVMALTAVFDFKAHLELLIHYLHELMLSLKPGTKDFSAVMFCFP